MQNKTKTLVPPLSTQTLSELMERFQETIPPGKLSTNDYDGLFLALRCGACILSIELPHGGAVLTIPPIKF